MTSTPVPPSPAPSGLGAAASAPPLATTAGTTNPIVTCGSCFSILSEPVTIRCGHSFCLRCIRSRLDRNGVGGKLTCQLCTQVDPDISLRNVTECIDLPLQQRLQALGRGAEGRPSCQWCEDAAATVYCHDCSYTLCSDCSVAVHKNSSKRSHGPVPLQDAKTIRTMSRKCPVRGHEEYRLEFYCTGCEALACAYCLQVGPHRGHESVLVSVAAQDVRKQMGRDLEALGQIKARIDGLASELNRVSGQYLESYDHVEALVADRFNAFKQQLLQKEIEVRKILASLRETGDSSLADSRLQFLKKINAINEAGMSFRRLQHGGTDVEVLQNRATMSVFLRLEVPVVSGTGFRLSDLGDLNLAGLSLSLDLNSHTAIDGTGGPQSATHNAPHHGAAAPQQQPGSAGSVSRGIAPPTSDSAAGRPRPPLRLTFTPDPDIDVREAPDGLTFTCSDSASAGQIGVRANETFEALRPHWQAEGGLVSWKVRLDRVSESFVGVVESQQSTHSMPDGFYWRPMKVGQYDGTVGRPTHVLRSIPACRPGDMVRLTYDVNNKCIKLAVNNIEKGIILADVPLQMCPCFVFNPGESLTLLY